MIKRLIFHVYGRKHTIEVEEIVPMEGVLQKLVDGGHVSRFDVLLDRSLHSSNTPICYWLQHRPYHVQLQDAIKVLELLQITSVDFNEIYFINRFQAFSKPIYFFTYTRYLEIFLHTDKCILKWRIAFWKFKHTGNHTTISNPGISLEVQFSWTTGFDQNHFTLT